MVRKIALRVTPLSAEAAPAFPHQHRDDADLVSRVASRGHEVEVTIEIQVDGRHKAGKITRETVVRSPSETAAASAEEHRQAYGFRSPARDGHVPSMVAIKVADGESFRLRAHGVVGLVLKASVA